MPKYCFLAIKNDKEREESYLNRYAKRFKKMKTDFGKRTNKSETLISFSKRFPDIGTIIPLDMMTNLPNETKPSETIY